LWTGGYLTTLAPQQPKRSRSGLAAFGWEDRPMGSVPARIGSFEVERELGRGGMGVVYLARDPRLERHVALKALPEAFLADPERRARLEREAKALAAASHPNIAGIFGLESAGDRLYLVLEYVAGETLMHRISRGPLPLDEAFELAGQIAAGIEAAHEAGVVHRDLKPANVIITDEGQVKILDFGLATGAGKTPISGSEPTLLDSPAQAFAATHEGVVLGTAAYMSPEQARGGRVDRRADLWGFGCILYEMLTGRQAFAGETVSDTLAAILRAEPDWSALPAQTPEAARRLLKRCLEKDARRRMRDAADAGLELEEARRALTVAPVAAKVVQARPWRAPIVWAGLAVALVAGGVLGWLVFGRPAPPAGTPPLRHLTLELPKGYVHSGWELAPDGSFLVIRASKETPGQPPSKEALYVRRLDSPELIPVKGSEGAYSATSPDSRWIFFVGPHPQNPSRRLLMKVPVDGSAPPVVVRDWDDAWQSGTFLPDGDLLFLRSSGRVMVRVPSAAGPEQPMEIDLGGVASALSEVLRPLPGGRAVLVDAITNVGGRFQFAVGLVDLTERKLRILVPDAGQAKLTPSGHMLYTHRDQLLMAPFDARRGVLTGEPVAVADGLGISEVWVNAEFDIGSDGTLVYRPGGYQGNRRFLAVLGADGSVTPWSDDRRTLQSDLAVSRDGRRLVVVVNSPDDRYELWTSDLDRPLLRRLCGEPNSDLVGSAFSADGARLAYQRQGFDERDGIYVVDWEGGLQPRILLKAESVDRSWSLGTWAPDSSGLILSRLERGRISLEFLAVDRTGQADGAPRSLVPAAYDSCCARFSPDGQLVAYLSREPGENQVVVAPWLPRGTFGPAVPLTNAKEVASRPLWAPDGRGLYFVDRADRLVFVPLQLDPLPSAGPPRVLASWEDAGLLDLYDGLVALPDGRFLAVCKGEDEREKHTRLEVVLGAAQAFAARLEQAAR
jgi:serine/threonine-protein kinase